MWSSLTVKPVVLVGRFYWQGVAKYSDKRGSGEGGQAEAKKGLDCVKLAAPSVRVMFLVFLTSQKKKNSQIYGCSFFTDSQKVNGDQALILLWDEETKASWCFSVSDLNHVFKCLPHTMQ